MVGLVARVLSERHDMTWRAGKHTELTLAHAHAVDKSQRDSVDLTRIHLPFPAFPASLGILRTGSLS